MVILNCSEVGDENKGTAFLGCSGKVWVRVKGERQEKSRGRAEGDSLAAVCFIGDEMCSVFVGCTETCPLGRQVMGREIVIRPSPGRGRRDQGEGHTEGGAALQQ